MAEAAVENIKDIPSCCICSEELRDPLGLPCLHVFCYECLQTWHQASQDQTQVVCPACKKSTPIPEGGLKGFPKTTLVKELKETIQTEAAEAEPASCTICNKQADSHCIDCDKSLCQSCLENHNSFIKDHKVVDAEDYQSGQVFAEWRLCTVHNKQVQYYCETDKKQVCMDCISLKTCPVEHVRITLKEATKKHMSSLEDLVKKCVANKTHFDTAVAGTVTVMDDLNQSVKQIKAEVLQIKQQYVNKVNQVFDQHLSDLDHLHKYRVKEIERNKDAHETALGKIDEAIEEAENLLSSKEQYLITNKYPSMCKLLESQSTSKPLDTVSHLGYIKFESAAMEVPRSGRLVRRPEWKLCDQINTQCKPQAIAVNHEGDIAITSPQEGIIIYSKAKQVKSSHYDSHSFYPGIVVSIDKIYIVANGLDQRGILFFDRHGKKISNMPVKDIHGKRCNINSVAVDFQGQIIVGCIGTTVSIHYANGDLISKFSTSWPINRLAATSKGHIAITFNEKNTLELIDYNGTTIKVIAPPPNVKVWVPGYVCCAEDELFVVNEAAGDPQGVFRYTASGDYLGCVTTEVTYPKGIALSQDGTDLFVVERELKSIKVFHRE